MTFEEAKEIILRLLQSKGKLTNRQMVREIGGDQELFEEIREELILDDLAKDKEGVGLIYIGPAVQPGKEGKSAAKREQETEKTYPSSRQAKDASAQPLRIFISYGRADAEDLAIRLEKDLSKRGHRIWLDKRQIKSGASWEEQIESAILEHEIFISLLTPHAVRRPDGVCLDEISMARYNGRKIIPGMVIQCRPPLGIFRLDWIDFQDWQNSERYEQSLNRLLTAMEREEMVEGAHGRIFAALKPLDFGAEVSRLTRDFTGRQWLLEEFEDWLRNDKSRVFFITGDPGTGKSAVMAHLVHKHPQVVAYHFCVSSLTDSRDPFRFVRSIASQLATQLDGYRGALDAVDLDQIAESDPGALLRRLVVDPLKGEQPEKPILLLVDALDEAFSPGGRSIAQVLRERLNDLPAWVRLVMSSRKEPEILDMFSRYAPHEVDAARAENLQDVATFLEKKFQYPALAEVFARSGADPQATAAFISKKGEGNFLYVTQVVAAIEAGQIDPRRPETFPDGLIGIYQSFFERVFPHGEGYDQFRPLLDIIVAAREPLSAEQIANFVDRDSFDVEKQLQKVAVFFPRRNGVYQVYHKSITDWLCGQAGHSLTYAVNLKQGHQRIAEKLLSGYKSDIRNRFTLAHLSTHLIGAQSWDDLETILTDLHFIEAKCAAGMTYDLMADYDAALNGLPEAQEERQKELEHEARVKKYTQDFLKFAKGESTHLDIISSVRFWNDDEIRKDTERIINNPSRLDRIGVYSQFVNSESHGLFKFGELQGFLLQQAYNWACSGPIVDKAESIVNNEINNVLILNQQSQRPAYRPHPAALKKIEGHEGRVNSIKISFDGKLAVTGSSDKTVRVWDLETGKCLKILKGHTDKIRSVSISPQGNIVASVTGSSSFVKGYCESTENKDNTLRLWDVQSGNCLHTLKVHPKGGISVSITPNGTKAVIGCSDYSLRIWDLITGVCCKILKGHDSDVNSVCITPDGNKIISGSGFPPTYGQVNYEKTLKVWERESEECLKTIEGLKASIEGITTGKIESICITPNGKRAIWVDSGKWCIWDIRSAKSFRTIEDPKKENVRLVNITSDGKKVISVSSDSTFRIWDSESGKCLRTIYEPISHIVSMSGTPDGKRFVSGHDDGSVWVWNFENGSQIEVASQSRTNSYKLLEVSPNGKTLLSLKHPVAKAIEVWDFENGKYLERFNMSWNIECFCYTQNGETILLGGGLFDNKLRLIEMHTRKCILTLKGHTKSINCVALTPDCKRAISSSTYKTEYLQVDPRRNIRIWDLRNGQCVRNLSLNSSWYFISINVMPDGKAAILGLDAHPFHPDIGLWDLESGECFKTLQEKTIDHNTLRITPDGKSVISIGVSSNLRVWDINRGSCGKEIKISAHQLRITPDGKKAITGGRDGTLRMWDLLDGNCIATYQTKGEILSISQITADGRFAYSTVSGIRFAKFSNSKIADPIVTSTRIWLYGKIGNTGCWDDAIKVFCKWCGQRFPVANEILDVITGITRNVNLSPDQSPCLELPEEAWDEPRLVSECPSCHKPLKFNPFVVDNRDLY